jgi:protein-S-isoprenylcysteine O-methyltransferase Ste14
MRYIRRSMALINSFENSGNWLFRYRGQLPVVLFLLAIPAIFLTEYNELSSGYIHSVNLIAVSISILGFLIRSYTIGTTPLGTSGRNTERQIAEQLNSTGIYSAIRHPLYLGNYLIWIGIVLYTKNIEFTVIVSLLFWLYYERIMFAEERFLERKFGQPYLDWSNKVPAFIPSFKKFERSSVPFSFKTVLRREYSGVLATVVGFAYVDQLVRYHWSRSWTLDTKWITALVITLIVTIVLRTLKHSTSILSQKDRS